MIYKIAALCSLTMVLLSLRGMEQDYFSAAPREIREYILALTLEPNRIRQSIKELYKLRSVSKGFCDLISKSSTLPSLAKKLGVTEHAMVLHIVQEVKLDQQQADILLAKYPVNQTLNSLLIDTSKKGSTQGVQLLLRENADVNTHDIWDRTALILAILYGRKDMVELLLKHGADVNARGEFGRTALILSVYGNAEDLVELLFKYCKNQ